MSNEKKIYKTFEEFCAGNNLSFSIFPAMRDIYDASTRAWFSACAMKDEEINELKLRFRKVLSDSADYKNKTISQLQKENETLNETIKQKERDYENILESLSNLRMSHDILTNLKNEQIKKIQKEKSELEKRVENMKCRENCKNKDCDGILCPCEEWE